MTEDTPKKTRRFITGRDIMIIAVVLLIAAAALWYMRSSAAKEGNIAIITVNGNEIMRLNLAEYQTKTERISLIDEYHVPVSFEIAEGGIRFVDVDCPDHLCEAMGVCREEYEMAVCLPNATLVAVYTPEDAPKAR